MADLIPAPLLDPRNEELLIAQIVQRLSERCPELTNNNSSSPHVVLAEQLGWGLGQMLYAINQVPERNLIELLRVEGITLRPATKAQTTLRFSVAAPVGANVTIPAGTQVSTADEAIIFETDRDLLIPAGTPSGEVTATRTVTGLTQLAPNKLVKQLDVIAAVNGVTNPSAIDSGAALESVSSALARYRLKAQRGERIVTAQNLEEAVLDEALVLNGIVRAFPFVVDGDYTGTRRAGYTTLVVMTSDGDEIGSEARAAVEALLTQCVGNQFISVRAPEIVAFDVTATVQLTGAATQTATLQAIERNLRRFYAPASGNFGRSIYRADIIREIESTMGVARLVTTPTGPILTAPEADVPLAEWQMPKLVEVEIHVA